MIVEKYLNLTEVEKAQIAMAIDCEGCIAINLTKSKYKATFSGKLFISNTDLNFLKYIKDIIGLGEVKLTYKSSKYMKTKETTNWKQVYMWVIYPLNMRKLLPIIYPYLIIKKQVAKLAIEFLGQTKGSGYHLTREKWVKRLEILNKIRILNNRGIKPPKLYTIEEVENKFNVI